MNNLKIKIKTPVIVNHCRVWNINFCTFCCMLLGLIFLN